MKGFYKFANSIVATPSKRLRLKPANNGFALVVALTMMVLLMIVAVGLLGLSSVSLRTISQSSAQQEAQANARMALMIALGELQASMGPDQRISITADQLSDPGSDGSTTSSVEGNRHWTGVYRSWPSSSVNRPDASGNFEVWLISGDRTLTSRETAPETGLNAANSVELVGRGTLGQHSDEDRVVVPAIDVVNGMGSQGRYAWWVGDQGVKAAIAPPPPATDNSFATIRNNTQSAPRSAIELATINAGGGVIKPFETLAANDGRLPKIISWPTASFLASNNDDPRALFHDLTAQSIGLLTNVREGGFRKDLSMLLETFSNAPDLSDPANILYTVRSSVTGNHEVGINFMELWAYYHLYKQLEYGNSLTYTTGGNVPSAAPLLQTKNSVAGIVADNWDMFKHPIAINRDILVSFEVYPYQEFDQPPSAPGDMPTPRTIDNALFINFDPVITLWNPLDVPVHIQSFQPVNTPRRTGYLCGFAPIPYDIQLTVGGTS